MKSNQKGAHSPDMRLVSMGVYPIQKVNSQVVGQDDVSKERLSAFKKKHLKNKLMQANNFIYTTTTLTQMLNFPIHNLLSEEKSLSVMFSLPTPEIT